MIIPYQPKLSFYLLVRYYASCIYSHRYARDMVGYLNNDIPALIHILG
jgi:hypothetical protein